MIAYIAVLILVNFLYVHCQHIFPNGTRNKYVWPFNSTSIWNQPIGSNAIYVYSGINGSAHFTVDLDIWLVTNDKDPTVDWYSPYSWDERCYNNGHNVKYPYKVPLPSNYIMSDARPPSTPNNCAAILLPDGTNILQANPMCRNVSNGPMFGWNTYAQDPANNKWTSIYGNGYYGGHSGSGLSSIGGTIRMGELSPNNSYPIRGSIRHAIKYEFWGAMYYYRPPDINSDPNGCKRWPAVNCDGYWKNPPNQNGYGGVVNATRQGSLLAIRPDIAQQLNDTLQTIPAQMMLWTLTDYGAYIVDDSAWDSQQFCVEYGVDIQFEKDWGFSMHTGSPFADDMIEISKHLMVVNNNSPTNIGGGGTPRQPLPPPIGN